MCTFKKVGKQSAVGTVRPGPVPVTRGSPARPAGADSQRGRGGVCRGPRPSRPCRSLSDGNRTELSEFSAGLLVSCSAQALPKLLRR